MSRDNRKIRFGLWYDFRNPSQWHQPPDQLYAATLDQIAWSDNHGFDDVWLSEHHFIEDGYLPSILPVAAAVAARTIHAPPDTYRLVVWKERPAKMAQTGGIRRSGLSSSSAFNLASAKVQPKSNVSERDNRNDSL